MLTIDANKTGLYIRFLVKLKEAFANKPINSKTEYLDFKALYSKICRNFAMPKEEVHEYLRIFLELGYISMSRTKGIKLNYEVQDG